MNTATKRAKNWFKLTDDQDHERTLQDQIIGLRPIFDEIKAFRAKGRPLTVLDLGCAEGLIGMELAKAGAAHVHGVEIMLQRVQAANRLRGSLPCSFEHNKVDYYKPKRAFDVVLALSILHKMPSPSETLRGLVQHTCDRLVVIRLPPGNGPVVKDRRSGNVPHDLDAVLRSLGFNLEQETEGHLSEWIGYWRFKQ